MKSICDSDLVTFPLSNKGAARGCFGLTMTIENL